MPSERLHPVGAAGNVDEAMPESGSEAVTVKLREPAGLLKYTVMPAA